MITISILEQYNNKSVKTIARELLLPSRGAQSMSNCIKTTEPITKNRGICYEIKAQKYYVNCAKTFSELKGLCPVTGEVITQFTTLRDNKSYQITDKEGLGALIKSEAIYAEGQLFQWYTTQKAEILSVLYKRYSALAEQLHQLAYQTLWAEKTLQIEKANALYFLCQTPEVFITYLMRDSKRLTKNFDPTLFHYFLIDQDDDAAKTALYSLFKKRKSQQVFTLLDVNLKQLSIAALTAFHQSISELHQPRSVLEFILRDSNLLEKYQPYLMANATNIAKSLTLEQLRDTSYFKEEIPLRVHLCQCPELLVAIADVHKEVYAMFTPEELMSILPNSAYVMYWFSRWETGIQYMQLEVNKGPLPSWITAKFLCEIYPHAQDSALYQLSLTSNGCSLLSSLLARDYILTGITVEALCIVCPKTGTSALQNLEQADANNDYSFVEQLLKQASLKEDIRLWKKAVAPDEFQHQIQTFVLRPLKECKAYYQANFSDKKNKLQTLSNLCASIENALQIGENNVQNANLGRQQVEICQQISTDILAAEKELRDKGEWDKPLLDRLRYFAGMVLGILGLGLPFHYASFNRYFFFSDADTCLDDVKNAVDARDHPIACI